MTDKVQKIREEVVRMHNLLPVVDGDNISVNYADRICTTLEMYIDSMQEEPKFKIGDVIRFKGNETLEGEKETHKIVGYDNELYIFDDGTTNLFCEQELYELAEEPVNEDFEEAANNALNNVLNDHEIVNVKSCLEMFKLGAEWKEKEMQSTIELAEDHAMFAGMVKGKEETIEKALVAFQVVCNCQAKLLPNCNKFCNRCEQFKQAIKDE